MNLGEDVAMWFLVHTVVKTNNLPAKVVTGDERLWPAKVVTDERLWLSHT